MAKVDNPGIWEKIQKNVQETERLMGQKKYNQSMIKARQTLEYMVKLISTNVHKLLMQIFHFSFIIEL